MAIHLNDHIADLSQTYIALKQRPDKDTVQAFGKKVLGLRKLLKDVLNELEIFGDDEKLSDKKLQVWTKSGTDWKLERIKRADEKILIEESTELATFFTNLSNSVIDAQKQLNELSQDYIDDLEDRESPIPPTYFAIPSIKAEMKLGVTEMTSKGVNVVFFKKQKEEQHYFESSVTFELVSTPPAPATRPREIGSPPHSPPPGPPKPELPVPELVDFSERVEPIESEAIEELVISTKETRAALLTAIESLEEETKKARARPAAAKKAPRKAAAKKPAKKRASKKK